MATITDEEVIVDELKGIAVDTVREVRKNKVIFPIILGGLCFIAIIVYFIWLFPLIGIAKNVGHTTGEQIGYYAGVGVGSFNGFTQAIPEGVAEGTEEGLSAVDTVTDIANRILADIKDMGRLQVLAANVSLPAYSQEGKKYAALYLFRGNATFSIDLNKAKVKSNDNSITIELPVLTCDLKIDPTETEVLSEWQRTFFNGTDREGFEGYMNTFMAIQHKSETEIENYAALMSLAKEAAEDQIKKLAESTRINPDIPVTISWQG